MNDSPLVQSPGGIYALSWNSAQDGKFIVETDRLTIADANPAAEKMTGLAKAELVGMELTALAAPLDRERLKAEFDRGYDAVPKRSSISIVRRDGHLVPMKISTSGTLDWEGQGLRVVELRDISGLLAAERQLSAQNWALSAFSVAAEALGQAETAEELLQSICDAITAQSAYVLAWVGIGDESPEKSIRMAAASGLGKEFLDGLHLSWNADDSMGQGPTGMCIRGGAVQILEDTEESGNFRPSRERARQFGIRSGISVPLTVEGWGRGDLVVYSALPKAFGAEAVEVFEQLAALGVRGIWALEQKKLLDAERARLVASQRQLAEALAASVFAMVTAMEARDPYTANHETRVGEIAVAIGRELGWDRSRLEALRLSAMVHDVGKIGIPSEVLNKPGRLSDAEFELVKKHPEIGYSILKDIPFAWPVADMVRQHHEKLDGSGYPQGLRGHEILPESKVLAVADIVEAMGSDRPYRVSLGLKAALAEIESMAGTKLDAEAVAICCLLFRERRLVLAGLNGK